jgi:hypothetical protein
MAQIRMSPYPLVISLLSAPIAALVAQTTTPDQAVFGEDVQRFAADLHLPSLPGGVQTGSLEIRLWEGFGVTGVTLYRIRRLGDSWSAIRVYPADRAQPARIDTLAASSEWAARWAEAQTAGFWNLPPAPVRSPEYVPVDDGWSVVVEVADGARYHISGSDNPQRACTADDKHLLDVVRALIPTLDARCPP